MAEQISIWRWCLEGDLDAQFAELLAADADQFSVIAAQMAGEGAGDLPSIAQTQAETEAKIRAMGLPDDVLQTTLEGFRAMVAEAEEEQAALDEEPFEDDGFGDGVRVGAALASSHMFFDDPFASLEYSEIDRQVDAALDSFKAAISKALGDNGQSFADYLGIATEALHGEAAFDALMSVGVEGAVWVWEQGEVAYYLSQLQEDKELPIDLEFHRFATAQLAAIKEKIG